MSQHLALRAALVSIVLISQFFQRKKLQLCSAQAFPTALPIFTQLFYLTCLQNKLREKIWCQENLLYCECCEFVWLREVSAEKQSCAIRGIKLWGIHEFWFASIPVFLKCLKTYETLESDLFFPFQSLMSITTLL